MLTRNQIHDRLGELGGQIKAAYEAVREAEANATEQARIAGIAKEGAARSHERFAALIRERDDLARQYMEVAQCIGETDTGAPV